MIITIQGTIIDVPVSGTSPDWSPAMDAFMVAVQNALSGVAGAFDVSPQVLTIDSSNPGTADITGLAFAPTIVRAVFIKYAVFRTTTTTTAYESGELEAVYSPANPVNNKWDISRVLNGDGQISFAISDIGQVSYTTTMIAGLNHSAKITYSATALLQS